MILKIYHLGGTVKYSGISHTIPKQLKYKLRYPNFKLYDIGGIMLYLFKDLSLLKEFNEKGEIMDIGYVKNGNIVKEMIKKNKEEEQFSTPTLRLNTDTPLFFHYVRNLFSNILSNTIDNSINIIGHTYEVESTVFSYDEYEDEYEGEVIHGIPNGKGIFYEKKKLSSIYWILVGWKTKWKGYLLYKK